MGGDLEPGTLIEGYRAGMFPMPLGNQLGWFSPDPRAVLPVEGLRVSRSLRRSMARMDITVDVCFGDVIRACADPYRPHGWITQEFIEAYSALHELGWAHSVETWLDGELAGGLYGIAIGSFFAGESMFHHRRDASKAALVALVRVLEQCSAPLLDVQWATPHLESLGVTEVPRDDYLDALQRAVLAPAALWHAGVPGT
jgi:leucyl/phenylalanyl-tRNA--protein transferase